jgi:hypothetical protein
MNPFTTLFMVSLVEPSTEYQKRYNFAGDTDRAPVSRRGCCSLSPLKLGHNVAVRFMEHNLSQMTVDRSLYGERSRTIYGEPVEPSTRHQNHSNFGLW